GPVCGVSTRGVPVGAVHRMPPRLRLVAGCGHLGPEIVTPPYLPAWPARHTVLGLEGGLLLTVGRPKNIDLVGVADLLQKPRIREVASGEIRLLLARSPRARLRGGVPMLVGARPRAPVVRLGSAVGRHLRDPRRRVG